MSAPAPLKDPGTMSVPAARAAIAAAATTLVLLASLHVLSPEFAPSLHVISQYANGGYAWVLSLMFAAWGISSWALAVALWPHVTGIGGRIALGVLIAAGTGQAMAAACDINHPLHYLAGALGVLGLAIAAMLISVRLARTSSWRGSRSVLIWTANLTWIIPVVMFADLFIVARGYTLAGQKIVFVGWANRLLVVSHCVWTMTAAGQAMKQSQQAPSGDGDSTLAG